MVTIAELPTPALLLDRTILQTNISKMAELLPGERLRPHVKAHKSTAIAALQYAAGHHGFTCATPKEMLGLGAAGVGDELLLANETVAVDRLRPLAELNARVVIAVDSKATIDAVVAAGLKEVIIDVNVGLPRCGVLPQDAGACAAAARDQGLSVAGVMGYEGHLMMVLDRDEQQRQVAAAMEQLLTAHQHVGGAIVSAGGTGTFDLHATTGVNEVQAGSYVLMDSDYNQHPFPFQQSLFIVGTVISVAADWAVLDVGLKAHGMDHGNPSVIGGTTLFLSDEHLTFVPDAAVAVGDRVRVIPAHCDPTVALHEKYYVVDGDEIVDEYAVDLRGW